jgi:hypothetical protein
MFSPTANDNNRPPSQTTTTIEDDQQLYRAYDELCNYDDNESVGGKDETTVESVLDLTGGEDMHNDDLGRRRCGSNASRNNNDDINNTYLGSPAASTLLGYSTCLFAPQSQSQQSKSGSETPLALQPFQLSSQAFESALYHDLNMQFGCLSMGPSYGADSKYSNINPSQISQPHFYQTHLQRQPPPPPTGNGKLTDQNNPPCNTLYVGNLPMNASEDELRSLFLRQPGYKRLCFRNKGNGPMCFVEFENIQLATQAMHDLYGTLLSNSTKGMSNQY